MTMNPNYSQDRYDQRGPETRIARQHTDRYPDEGARGARLSDEQRYDAPKPGRFDLQRLSINLVMLALLGGVIVGAVVFLADVLVSRMSGAIPFGMSFAVLAGVFAGLVGVAIGLLYIPVLGSGSEGLYNAAIAVLTVVLAVVFVVFGGLLDGDYTTLIWLAALMGTAFIALATPGRIEAAEL